MRISRWKHRQQLRRIGSQIVLVILLSSLYAQLTEILPFNKSLRDDEVNVDSLADNSLGIKVPRLTTDINRGSVSDLIASPPYDRSFANLAIGQQSGVGGGIYSAFDSFNWTGEEVMNTSNTYVSEKPTSNIDSLTVTDPAGYNRQYGLFNITNVLAEYNKTNIEDTDNYNFNFHWDSRNILAPGDGYYEVAMSFEIKEAFAYIRTVRTYIAGVASATGKIYITNATGGNVPNDINITSKEDLGSTGEAWHEYTFDTPVLLQGGQTYFVVMNETNADDNSDYWRWFYIYDTAGTGDGVDEGIVCYKEDTHATWNTFASRDLPLQLEILPVEWNGTHYAPKEYSNPSTLDFTYESSEGTTKLSTFNQFNWNDSIWHRFVTNTSVSFNVSFVANYTYGSNPILATPTYLVSNGSVTSWNLTFTTPKVNTTYSVRNHTVRIANFEADWNGTNIYWNNTLTPQFSDLPANTSVSPDGDYSNRYQHGIHTTMYVNASDLSENTTWHVWFSAPNHLLNFTIGHGNNPLAFPYQANITDILNLTFYTSSTGNLTYWIDYPNGSARTRLNINPTDTVFGEEWDINKTVDQTINVNGTYWLQAFWNNSGLTQVGTFTRKLDIYVNTSLTPQADGEVIVGEKFNVTALYRSKHNDTDIRGARIWANASWPLGSKQNVTMNQLGDDSYNASFTTIGQAAGFIGTVTINTHLGWFVNWTQTIVVKFVEVSSLTVNKTVLKLQWRENMTLRIDYNTSLNSAIENATVTVNGSTTFNDSNNFYYYRLNTTSFLGVGTYLIPINASHGNYSSQNIVITLSITPGETGINGSYKGQALANTTTVPENQIYAASSQDQVFINLRYHSTYPTDLTINVTPSVNSQGIPDVSFQSETNSTWTIILNPDAIGLFTVDVTFDWPNYYNASSFVFQVNVIRAATEITSGTTFPSSIYFTDSSDFYLLYNNTVYNELIPSVGPGINDSAKIQFLNHTGDTYWFRFNSSQSTIGTHAVLISLAGANFEASNITVVFTVTEMPTLSIPLSQVHVINNGTVLIEDSLEITIDSFQTFRGINITHLDEISYWLNTTIVPESILTIPQFSQAPFSISISTVGWQYGFYNLTLQVQTIGYQPQFVTLNITLLGRSTWMELEIQPGKTISQGENITLIVSLHYETTTESGFGSSLNLVPLESVEVFFYVVLMYNNETSGIYEQSVLTDINGQATYVIDGQFTLDSIGFENITVSTGSSLSGLPTKLGLANLEEYHFVTPPRGLWELLAPLLLPLAGLIAAIALAAAGVYRFNKSRKARKVRTIQVDRSIEKGFEDIKSIRLVIARHQSGLQFYSEKTIAELQADTDALSGMSAALSSFMEEVSESMRSRKEDSIEAKIETMSREGLHMLVWHGRYSSLLIISEIELPEYFRDRLDGLGHETEDKFEHELKDFYSTDQIPASIIKKIVRKHVPLHYFSAFVLNEGVLTLKDIKLSKKHNRMLKMIKKIMFTKEGVEYLFSEQIISYLATKYKRSEAIKFLDHAIELNLLVECNQEDLIQLGR
ncbi:MAG: hypothetical protein ACFFFG_16705 [Candidatus Thorarchaeota archaeon]